MRISELFQIAIVVIVLGIAIAILTAHNNKINFESNSSAQAGLIWGNASGLRVIFGLVLALFIQEYLAYEVRSGYASLLIKTGVGIKRYILEKLFLFITIIILLAIPTYIIVAPFNIYSDVLLNVVLGDLFTIMMFSFIFALTIPNILLVVLVSILATYAIRIYLFLAIGLQFRSDFLWHLMQIHMYDYPYPAPYINTYMLYISNLLYIALILISTIVLSIKIVMKRGIYRWG